MCYEASKETHSVSDGAPSAENTTESMDDKGGHKPKRLSAKATRSSDVTTRQLSPRERLTTTRRENDDADDCLEPGSGFTSHDGTMLTKGLPNSLGCVVMPTRLRDNQAQVYLPPDQDEVWGFDGAHLPLSSITAEVERAVQHDLQLSERPFALRAGKNTHDKMLMVAITNGGSDTKAAEKTCTSLVPRAKRVAMWCTISALAVASPATHWATVAACTVREYAAHDAMTRQHAIAEWNSRTALGLNLGVGRPIARRVDRLKGGSITPRQLYDEGNFGLRHFRGLLEAYEGPARERIREWSASLAPLEIGEMPRDLWDKPLRLSAETIGSVMFSPRLPIYELPALPRMPKQANPDHDCAQFKPSNAYDLISEEATLQVQQWMANASKDLQCLQQHGAGCERKERPRTVVIGQGHFRKCAKGKVWDCTQAERCTLLNYQGEVRSNFDLNHLKQRFEQYPDQRLASNVLDGIRLEADIEHQIVLQPNSMTVGAGYQSVQKTVRELAAMDFYDFHRSLPYVPIFVVSQGSRIKKGGSKYRRTSDFSGPHKRHVDEEGVEVTPVNEASKVYRRPRWLMNSDEDELLEWDRARYAHVKWKDEGAREAPVRFKFPKEYKPKLTEVLLDGTILLAAALELQEPIIMLVSDAAYYFNQFGYAPEELWKSTLVVGAQQDDLDLHGIRFHNHEPVFVSEHRLGFGSFASSNIAQRFSNAIVSWTLDRFDQLEREAYMTQHSSMWARWRERRLALDDECRRTRPRRAGEAPPDCNQTRLATVHMYTDDPVMIVVGAERAMRLLRAWHEVTEGVGLVMAGPEKRQAGPGVEWIGVLLLGAIGVVVVPRHKLVRARSSIIATLEGRMTFEEYRAMVGLLEHLRFIAQWGQDATNVLYRPHGKGGEQKDGPATIIRPDELMTEKLTEWADIIMSCAGALFTAALLTDEVAVLRASRTLVWASSDAASDGKGSPGIGGYIHGHYWRVPLTKMVLSMLHITAWELVAAAVNLLVAARLAGKEAALLMRSDAVLVAPALTYHASKSRMVQLILHALRQVQRYREAADRMTQEHISGEGNIFADLVSRGLWEDFHRLCESLGIRTTAVRLVEDEVTFLTRVINAAASNEGARFEAIKQILAAVRPPTPSVAPINTARRPLRIDPSSSPVPVEERGQSANGPPEDPTRGNKRDRSPYTHAGTEHRISSRALTHTEKGLGKSRRDNPQGDGPPPWSSSLPKMCTTAGFPSSVAHTPWTHSAGRPACHPKQATTTSPTRQIYSPSLDDSTCTPTRARAITPHSGTSTYATPVKRLSEADQEEMERLVRRLLNDRSAGRVSLPEAELRTMVEEITLAKAEGVNPRSKTKHDLAWKEFCTYAALHGFDPNLRTAWTRSFPERESLKLAGFLLFTTQRMRPRSSHDPCAKPQSVYQRYLALRRVFANRDQELPNSMGVRAAFKGLLRRFLAHHGIANLRPKRVEPITPAIVKAMVALAIKSNKRIRGRRWSVRSRECFSVTAWAVVNLQVGSRKGESVRLPGDTSPNDWYTRSSVTYRIGGQVYSDPPPHALTKMRLGDVVYLAPKGAKCDQWGTCWGTDPIVLPFHDDDLNPAKWLRDMEMLWPCVGEQREHVALFAQEDGTPFSDSVFSSLIHSVLGEVVGHERARLYSPHSWRVWLASALRVLGAPDPLIQAFGRWMNPDSLKVYSRMTALEYTTWMDKIMTVKSLDATRVTNLPIMDTIDMVREWEGHHAMALFDTDLSVTAAQRLPKMTRRSTAELDSITKRPRTAPAAANERGARHPPMPPLSQALPRRGRPCDPPAHTRPSHRRCTYFSTTVGRLATTTTGVGSVTHAFPNSLEGYRTYNERESTRRKPTPRGRT